MDEIDFEIYFIFSLFILVFLLFFYLLIIPIPINIAKKRKHSKKDAIKVCSWCGLLFLPCWVIALIWAHTEDNRSEVKKISKPPLKGVTRYPVYENHNE